MTKLFDSISHVGARRGETPCFTTIDQCEAWLNALPVTNISEANKALSDQLIALAANPLAPLPHITILETLLTTIVFVQTEYEKKIATKALPLSSTGEQAFNDICRLWHRLGQSYSSILSCSLDGNKEVESLLPLMCQRSMACCVELIKDHYRIHRQIGSNLWFQLHGYYEIAEVRGFTDVGVTQRPGSEIKVTTCKATYAESLLLDIAGPYNLSQWEFDTCCQLVKQWAYKLQLTSVPEDSNVMPYAIDLSSDTGPEYSKPRNASDSIRYLGVSKIAASLLSFIEKLSNNQEPAEKDLTTNHAENSYPELLNYLNEHWCTGRSQRKFERHETSHQVQACTGFEFICHFIDNKASEKKIRKGPYNWEGPDLSYMGRQFDASTIYFSNSNIVFAIENWHVRNGSKTGFYLTRSVKGARLAHGQLVAIRSPNRACFFLCHVRRLKQKENGTVDLGVQVLPGAPMTIAIRTAGISAAKAQKFTPAILLETKPGRKGQLSLILPHGWYSPGKTIEISGEDTVYFTLDKLIARGSDFDQVSFVPVSKPTSAV